MKKTVKSEEELRKLALSKGAKVKRSDGKVFNEKRAKARKVAPKPKEPPAPPPLDPNAGLERRLESMTAAIGASSQVTQDLIRQMRQHVDAMALASPAPATVKVERPKYGWVFDVRRDDDGLIEQIIASPRAAN